MKSKDTEAFGGTRLRKVK